MRFLGETDFAKGEWCGVELDEPLGKNDGAVAGTRLVGTLKHIDVCVRVFSIFLRQRRGVACFIEVGEV